MIKSPFSVLRCLPLTTTAAPRRILRPPCILFPGRGSNVQSTCTRTNNPMRKQSDVRSRVGLVTTLLQRCEAEGVAAAVVETRPWSLTMADEESETIFWLCGEEEGQRQPVLTGVVVVVLLLPRLTRVQTRLNASPLACASAWLGASGRSCLAQRSMAKALHFPWE